MPSRITVKNKVASLRQLIIWHFLSTILPKNHLSCSQTIPPIFPQPLCQATQFTKWISTSCNRPDTKCCRQFLVWTGSELVDQCKNIPFSQRLTNINSVRIPSQLSWYWSKLLSGMHYALGSLKCLIIIQ